MDTLTLDDVLELARARGESMLSFYMPTHRFAPGSHEADVRRLKNLQKEAETRLAERGLRPSEVDETLAPIRALAEDRPFWMRSGDGLALFSGAGSLTSFQLAAPVPEIAWVGARFYLKPLLAHLGSSRTFWLLALSQKHVQLLRGSRHDLEPVPAEGVPESLADAMRWDDFEKSSLQFHTQTSSRGGRRPAVFHGTGETDVKDELVRYFRGIDRGLRDLLRESGDLLVLAGVDYLLPLYRDVNTYPNLTDEAVAGSPENLGAGELHERAWSIVERIVDGERAAAVARAEELWASARTTPDAATIVPAALQGRVETLFVATDAQWWGAYDEASGAVSLRARPSEGDEELLDVASLHTLVNGGEVFALPADEIPHAREAVAILRY